MAIVILEGVDRSGKSSVAKLYESQGYKVVHMSAPDKKYKEYGYVGPSYLDDYIDMLSSWGVENVVMDRSAYGELIWPRIYGREPLLSEDDIEVIAEIESVMGVERILMEDPDQEAHWKRCVDNKEPLNKNQFITARAMYNTLVKNYGFRKQRLADFPKPEEKVDVVDTAVEPGVAVGTGSGPYETVEMDGVTYEIPPPKLTPEQTKLAKANAINTILSKTILKAKGPEFVELENDIRGFLNTKLGLLLGSSSDQTFNQDEVEVLKMLCTQLKQKEQLKNGRK